MAAWCTAFAKLKIQEPESDLLLACMGCNRVREMGYDMFASMAAHRMRVTQSIRGLRQDVVCACALRYKAIDSNRIDGYSKCSNGIDGGHIE